VLGIVVFWKNMSMYEDKGNPPNPESLKQVFFAGMKPQAAIILGGLIAVPIFSFLIDFEKITDILLVVCGVLVLGYVLITALKDNKEDGQRMLVFLCLFFFHMIFWTLFEQAGGSLNILADRYVNRGDIPAGQFQSLNALFIMLLAPVFSWIWIQLSKKGKEPRTPMKFFYGLLQIALGFWVIVIGAKSVMAGVNSGALIPVIYLVVMYLFHTTGELSISPVGLSVVTKLAPAKVVGFVMGAWFLSIAFGHKIAGELGKQIASPAEGTDAATALNAFVNVYQQWGVYVTLGAAAILLLISPMLKKWMHGIQ
jgi:POT family proton-dependent oligopeptide transporter